MYCEGAMGPPVGGFMHLAASAAPEKFKFQTFSMCSRTSTFKLRRSFA